MSAIKSRTRRGKRKQEKDRVFKAKSVFTIALGNLFRAGKSEINW